jgi:hypothetical protein
MKTIPEEVKYLKPKISAVLRDANLPDDDTGDTSARLTLSDADFVQGTLTFNEATSNSGEITIGAAIIGSCNFTLYNTNNKFTGYNWTNSAIDITLIYDSTPVFMGTYYIVSHTESGKTIKVETLDPLQIMDSHMLYETGITFPCDAVDAITKIATYGINGIKISGLDNSRGVTVNSPDDDQISNRDAISYLAQILGKYALFRGNSSTDNTLYFGWYDFAKSYDVGMTFSHDLRTDDLAVTGVLITSADGETTATRGAEGYILEIADNPFIDSENIETIADRISTAATGLTFRPGNFAIRSNPEVEAGDVIMISTGQDKNIKTIASNVTYKPANVKQSITADAEAASGDLQISIQQYIKKVVKAEVDKATGDGGGEGGLSPDNLYKILRPSDWIEMPIAGENEAYILILIPDDSSNKLSLSITTSSQDDTVSVYTGSANSDGTLDIVTDDTMESTTNSSFIYSFQISIDSNNYVNITSDGYKQFLTKIECSAPMLTISCSLLGGDNYIAEFRGNASNLTSSQTYSIPSSVYYATLDGNSNCKINLNGRDNLVLARNFVGNVNARNCSKLTSVEKSISADENASSSFYGDSNLQYVGISHNGDVFDGSRMFYNCSSLALFQSVSINANSINMNSFCYGCTSLLYFPKIKTSGTAVMTSAFSGCSSLMQIGDIDCGDITACNSIFYNCTSLKSVTLGTLGNGTTATNLFNGCTSLRAVTLNINGSFTLSSNCFTNCKSLYNLKINSTDWGGSDLTLTNCPITGDNIVELFNSLPVADSSYTIKLSSITKGYISDDDIAIATEKGYTVS